MTKLDFPDTPSTGQQYGSSGTVWRWDGTRWGSTAGASGARGRVAYAQVTANQGGILAAAVAINGLSVTWVADPARTYRTTIFGAVLSSVANDQSLTYLISNPGGVSKAFTYTQLSSPPGYGATVLIEAIESGLSGSQTRAGQILRAAGSGTMQWTASPSSPSFILVEDITYEAGSGGPVAGVTVPRFRLTGTGGGQNHTGQWIGATWGTTEFDNGTLTSGGVFYVPPALVGRWRFDYVVIIQAWNAGIRQASLQRAGGTARNYAYQSTGSVSSTLVNYLTGSSEIELTTGQNVRVMVFQDAGTLAINGDTQAYFQGQYVGPST